MDRKDNKMDSNSVVYSALVRATGLDLTPLEQRVFEWGANNWRQLVALLDENITEETIVNYMIDNKCEDMPVDWVVNLMV